MNKYLDKTIRDLSATDILIDAALDAEDLMVLLSRVLWSTVKVAEKINELKDKYGDEVFRAACRETGLDERMVKALLAQKDKWNISDETRQEIIEKMAKKTWEVLDR